MAKLGRWVAKLIARLLTWQLSWFESRHLSKVRNGGHKQRSGQHTLARQKKYTKESGSSWGQIFCKVCKKIFLLLGKLKERYLPVY